MVEGEARIVYWLSRCMQVVAGFSLVFIMLLTTFDVIFRAFGRPIIGTYEIVAFSGGIAIGFSVPITSFLRGQIFVDFFYQRFSKKARDVLHYVTRIMCIILFLFTSYNLVIMGTHMQRVGEVSLTLHIPLYPFAYGIGFAFFVQVFVLIVDIFKIAGGTYE
jgi:TRAP-type C4-dicarboxylate transport system permease small subunit